MDKILNDYLEKTDRYLRPMPAGERVDIIKEIKSEMLELEAEKHLTPAEITERLGSPKELAKAYLGGSITKDSSFSLRKLLCIASFAGLAGGSIFILPFTGMLSCGLLLGGIISPIGGIIKLVGFLLGFDIPFIMFQIGSYTAHPLAVFPLSVLFGLLFFLAGRGLWRLTIKYVKALSSSKARIHSFDVNL